MVSSQEGAELELELPSEPRSVGEARRGLADLARTVGARESDVGLAVSEAVGNAVVHAYRDRPPGTILVSGKADQGRLTVIVEDDGVGMSPDLESPGLGFGISLITKVCLDVRFDSSDRGTTVTMSFPADAA